MKHIEIRYIIDDPSMTDEQYEDQEESVELITMANLIKILTYGLYDAIELPKGTTLGEITSVEIKN